MGRKESNQTNKQNQIQYCNVSHAIKKFYMFTRYGIKFRLIYQQRKKSR